jgi:predicted dehydrogenase
MVRVGITGIGFMGMIHYLAYQRIKGVKVVAMCESDVKRLEGDWRGIKGNFGPPGEMMDLSGVETYTDYDAMLASPKVDMVDICLPPALHADFTVKALQAGKHVFCEKPIALKTKEGERMVAAAKKAGKLLMIGQVLPFFPEYAYAYKLITSGKYGKLLGGFFKRIISEPLWVPGFFDANRVGGPLLDLHIHDAHFIRLLCGMPEAVYSSGRTRGEVVEFLTTQFVYPAKERLSVTATSGVLYQQGRSFTHAFEIYLEKATLLYDFAVIDGQGVVAMPLTVLDSKGKVTKPELGAADPIDAFEAELAAAAKAVKTGTPSPISSADLARDALILCQKQSESVFKGKLVKV